MPVVFGVGGRVGTVFRAFKLSSNSSRLWIALQLLVVLVLAACDDGVAPSATPGTPSETTLASEASPMTGIGAQEPTPVPSPTGLDEQGRMQLYVMVVSELVAREEAASVYVSPYIGQGERLDNPDERTPIPASLVAALEAADSGRAYFESEFGQVVGALEDGGKVVDGGVFVTLGPILNDATEEDVVDIRATIYRKVSDAEGYIYRYKRDASGEWKLLNANQEWLDRG
jgi:hypothetical protein